MSVEPEHNIEKELKAYAEQRRAAAGAPELPPATRKLLQEEAARQTKVARVAGGEKNSWWHVWSSWPRLATVGFAVVALAMIAWWLFPASNAERQNARSTMELAGNQTEGFNGSPPAAAKKLDHSAAPAPQRPKMPRAFASSPKDSEKSTPMAVDRLASRLQSTNATPAPESVPVVMPAPAFFSPAPVVMSLKAAPSGATGLSLSGIGGAAPQTASANRATSLSFSPQKDGADVSTDVPAATIIQPFRRTDFLPNANAPSEVMTASNVLFSFRVEQAMEKLRMIDSDGSIYNGFVTLTPETAKLLGATFQPAQAEDGVKPAAADGQQKQPARLYRFRVSGTNRTLNQEVVFTGGFLNTLNFSSPQSPATSNGPTTVGGNVAPSGGIDLLSLELQKALVEGRLSWGGTNKILINASPVKP